MARRDASLWAGVGLEKAEQHRGRSRGTTWPRGVGAGVGGVQESGWWSAWVSHPLRGATERPDGQLVHTLGSMEPSFWNKVVSVAFNTGM